jgi:tripartite-type tricarboxylate transporter receptor subunit TctC
VPSVLIAHPSLAARNVKELIALAKASPGTLTFGTGGNGTSEHLAAEMFKAMAGVDLVHVPFKGNSDVANALLGGHIKVYFSLVPASLQHVKAGTLRVLAVTTERRLPYLPDVPTIAESGFPGYEISSWQGLFAPGGTPADIVAKINGEVVRMLQTPDVQARISREGADPVGSSPAQFSARVKSEIEKWAKVVKAAGLGAAN